MRRGWVGAGVCVASLGSSSVSGFSGSHTGGWDKGEGAWVWAKAPPYSRVLSCLSLHSALSSIDKKLPRVADRPLGATGQARLFS